VPECAGKREVCSLRWLVTSERSALMQHPPPKLYYMCKRGQVDMRTRIRGNKGY